MKNWKYILAIILAAILCIYCAMTNKHFFEVTITDILLLLVTFLAGTYFVEKNSSDEKIKEKYESLLNKFEAGFIDKDALKSKLENGKNGEVLLSLRKLNNHLSILKEKSKSLGIEEEIKCIANDYETYNGKLSTHIGSPEKIDFDDLERLKVNIESKSDTIRFKLF